MTVYIDPDGRRRDPRADRIVRAVDGAGAAGLSRAEISALFSRHLTKDTLSALLAELTRDGRYELVKVPTGGRPSERYRRAKKEKEGD